MAKDVLYEIWIRKGDKGGTFAVADEKTLTLFGEMCAIAKGLVDRDEADEAVVLEKRIVKRFKKYTGKG
jgi:hypothetical protein